MMARARFRILQGKIAGSFKAKAPDPLRKSCGPRITTLLDAVPGPPSLETPEVAWPSPP